MTDSLITVARFLSDHLEWMRHRPEVDEFLTDVDAAVRVMRGLVRGPAEQRYLGPCGATPEGAIGVHASDGSLAYADDPMPTNVLPLAPCDGDVYGRAGGDKGTCRTCGAQVDQGERRAWLDDTVRQYAYRASEIAGAYGINVNTIRSWAGRGKIAQHGEDRDGRPLYNLGEVLDLAAGDAARRETNRAQRARRKEQAA